MPQNEIFFPMGALAFWTFIILILVPLRRVRASKAGKVKPGDFRFGESATVPGEVAIPNRNYMNLLELPMLFYVVCLMFYVAAQVDMPALELAWGFVALRLAHSAIHLTYNHVGHRAIIFAAGNFVLVAMWVLFFMRVFS